MRVASLFKLFFLFLLITEVAVASEITVSLSLHSIKAIQPSERSGDELYFKIMEYSNLGYSAESRFPDNSNYWVSSDLANLKDIPLWKGTLQDKESVKLIVSLIEKDLPPLDADDLLGNAQLMLVNNNGELKKEWGVPVFEETKEIEMLKASDPQAFMFKGDQAKYEAAFAVAKESNES